MKVSLWKVVLGLAIVALLAGGGAMLYRAGYARGVMSDVSFENLPFADSDFDEITPYGTYRGMGYGRSFGHSMYGAYSHFSLGRMLFGGLLFLFFVGGIFRLMSGCTFRRRYAYGMPPMHGAYREGRYGPPWMRYHNCRDENEGDEADEVEEE